MTDEPRLNRIIRLYKFPEFTGLGMTEIKDAIDKGELTVFPLTDKGRAKGTTEDILIAWQQRRIEIGKQLAAAAKAPPPPSTPKPKIKRRHLHKPMRVKR